MSSIYMGNDHDVSLTGAKRRSSGTYLNAATVTYALCATGTTTPVTNGTGTLTYVTGSNGNYLGVIEATVTAALTEGSEYDLIYTFAESGQDASWTLTFTAAKRTQ